MFRNCTTMLEENVTWIIITLWSGLVHIDIPSSFLKLIHHYEKVIYFKWRFFHLRTSDNSTTISRQNPLPTPRKIFSANFQGNTMTSFKFQESNDVLWHNIMEVSYMAIILSYLLCYIFKFQWNFLWYITRELWKSATK